MYATKPDAISNAGIAMYEGMKEVAGHVLSGDYRRAEALLNVSPQYLDPEAAHGLCLLDLVLQNPVAGQSADVQLEQLRWLIAHGAGRAMTKEEAAPRGLEEPILRCLKAGVPYIQALVEGYGADVLDVKMPGNGHSALGWAINMGKKEIVDFIVSVKPDLLHQPIHPFSSPLAFAKYMARQTASGPMMDTHPKYLAVEQYLLTVVAADQARRAIEEIGACAPMGQAGPR